MSAVAKTYTFVPGTPIESEQTNQNFDDLVNYINGEVIVRDASQAFTVIPVGPGVDPTTANQFTRKQYVDNADNARAKLDGTTAFTGIPSGPDSDPTTDNQFTRKKYVDKRVKADTANVVMKAADAVVTTDSFGQATVTFASAFPTAVSTIVVTSGDASVPAQFIAVVSKTTSNFVVRCFTQAVVADGFGGFTLQRAISQSVRVSYVAIGS
jgi:hypothetical protein